MQLFYNVLGHEFISDIIYNLNLQNKNLNIILNSVIINKFSKFVMVYVIYYHKYLINYYV